MKVFIGADHRGFELKSKILDWLKSEDYQTEDCGAFEYQKDDDFIEYAVGVCKRTIDEDARGIVICGSGAGVEIASNKIKGIRCSLGQSAEQVSKARGADNINVLAIASDFTREEDAKNLVDSFLKTDYDPAERHERRLKKINELEN